METNNVNSWSTSWSPPHDSTKGRSRWDCSPPICLSRWDSTPERSDKLSTQRRRSPICCITTGKARNRTGSKFKGHSYSLQSLIKNCQNISKTESDSDFGSSTRGRLSAWYQKRKRQRIGSDQGTKSDSENDDSSVIRSSQRSKRNRRRISSDSDSNERSKSRSSSSPRENRNIFVSTFRSVTPSSRSVSRSHSRSHSRSRSRSHSRSASVHRSKSTSPTRPQFKRRSSSGSTASVLRYKPNLRSDNVHRSRSNSRSTSISISRRCRSRRMYWARSTSAWSRRHRSRSKSPFNEMIRSRSKPYRYRSKSPSESRTYRSWSRRSRSNSTFSSNRQRSRSSSTQRSTNRRSRSRRQRSRSKSSSSTNKSNNSSSQSDSESDSSSKSSSGRRPWLRYRYRSPQERGTLASPVTRQRQKRYSSSSPKRVHSRSSSPSKSVPPVSNISPSSTDMDHSRSSPESTRVVTRTESDTTAKLFRLMTPDDKYYFKIRHIVLFNKAYGSYTFSKQLLDKSTKHISQAELDKRQLIGFMMKLENGPPEIVKEVLKGAQKLARKMDCCLLFNTLLPFLKYHDDRANGIAMLDAIIFRVGRKLKPFIYEILTVMVVPLRSEGQTQMVAVRVITKLAKLFGLHGILPFLKENVGSDNIHKRMFSCSSLAIVTGVFGIESMLPVIKTLCESKVSINVTKSGFEIIRRTVGFMKQRAQPYAKKFMEILLSVKSELNLKQHLDWGLAAVAVVKIGTTEDMPSYIAAWRHLLPIYRRINRDHNKVATAVQKAVFSILHVTSAATQEELEDLSATFTRMCASTDIEHRQCTIKVMSRLSKCSYIPDTLYDSGFLCPFITQFPVNTTAFNDTYRDQFIQICVHSSRKVGTDKVCSYVLHGLGCDGSEVLGKMAAMTLVSVLEESRLKNMTYSLERDILIHFCQAVNKLASKDTVILKSFLSMIKLMSRHLYCHARDIQQTLIPDKPHCSPQQMKLLQQIQSEVSGVRSDTEGSSGLVMDGCVWNATIL